MSDVYQGQNAEILRATIDGTPYTEQPESYIAQLLIELKEAIEAGGGGGGGTTNYNGLSNKPQINNVTLQGNKSLADLGFILPVIDAALSGTSENAVQNKVVKTALDAKQSKLTFDNAPTQNSNNPVKSGGVYTALSGKQDTLTFDNTPTAGSNNPVKSSGIKAALNLKVDTTALANYYNKTEVDELIGAIEGLQYEIVETLPTTDIDTHTLYLVPDAQAQNVYDEYLYINNAWANLGSTEVDLSNYYTKTQADNLLANKQDELTFDSAPTEDSTNPVTSGGVFTALAGKQDTLTIDSALSDTSENPVQNKAIYSQIYAQLYSTIAGMQNNAKGSMELYSKDLNTITTSGFYNAMTCANAPYDYMTLIVTGYYLSGYCTQIACDVTTGNYKFRTQTGGTWGAWTDNVLGALSEKQTKTLETPIVVEGSTKTTVEAALGGINEATENKLAVVAIMPTASVDLLDKQRLYVGTTTATYTKGTIYECQLVPESDPAEYAWVAISTADVDLSNYQTSFTGTKAEWDALTSAQKALYNIVYITDDNSGISLDGNYIVWEG